MSTTTLEATQFPTITVGKKTLPIGPLSLYQTAKLAHFLANLARKAVVANRLRQAEYGRLAEKESREAEGDLRHAIADQQGVNPEDVRDQDVKAAQSAFFLERVNHMLHADGYDGNEGMLFEFIEILSEDELTEFVRVVIERDQHARITLDWVREHFAPAWFIEALTIFVAQNDIQGIVKNLQRLIQTVSTQYQNQAI